MLISIGIVASDGRTYYAISSEFKRRHCNDWVRKNVLTKLPPKYIEHDELTDDTQRPILIMNPIYRSVEQMKEEIIQFVAPDSEVWMYAGGSEEARVAFLKSNPPVFKAYFADYDWVLFCTIFGTMMDLPKGYPMYCVDLKQELDRIAVKMNPDLTKETAIKLLKGHDEYPPQNENEAHDALIDALWNEKLDRFLTSLNQ